MDMAVADEVGPVRFEQVPVDDMLGEEAVDVPVAGVGAGSVEVQVVPVADAGQQLEPQQRGEPVDRQRLALGVGMDHIGLDVGVVVQQPVEDVDRFPHPTRDESGEQGDVGVGNVPVRDPAETPMLAVAEYADHAVIVDADVFRGVGRFGDGVIGMVTRSSSR